MMDAAYGEGLGKSDVSTGRGMFDEIASRGRLQSVNGQEAARGKRGSASYGPRLQIYYLDHHEDLRRSQCWSLIAGNPQSEAVMGIGAAPTPPDSRTGLRGEDGVTAPSHCVSVA